MEVWINTDKEKIMLPITTSIIGIDRPLNFSTTNIIGQGDVPIYDGKGLKSISLSGFFPYEKIGNSLTPYEYSEKFQLIANNNQVARLIVTDSPTNMQCKITNFSTREQNGTRNLYFDMTLQEHKDIVIPKIKNTVNKTTTQRPTPPPQSTQRTHRVMPNDSLWAIAKRYYGDGGQYPKIKQANWDKYPSLKENNIIYAIKDGGWVLVIP